MQHLFANWRDIEELMKLLLDLLQGCYKDLDPPINLLLDNPLHWTYVSLKSMILIVCVKASLEYLENILTALLVYLLDCLSCINNYPLQK